MTKAFRSALIGWGTITFLVILEFLWIFTRHGMDGFGAFMQEAVYTHIPITLASVALTWLLAGFLLWLLFTRTITPTTLFTWGGFFIVAFLYINILRERVRYGDIDYYTQAAFALLDGKSLPDSYFYPPLWATLLSFLTPLGEDGILLVAWLANLLSFLLFYFLLHRTLEHYQFKPQAAALATTLFLLVNMAVLRTFMYVQVNFHVMNFILLSILFYRHRPLLSALMLALAIHFKASPAVLALAFLLEFNWKWLAGFVASLLLIAAFPYAIYGASPYYDFIKNFLFLNAPHGLSLHDSSFDSAIGMALSYVRADFSVVRILVLLAKATVAVATVFLCLRSRGFFSGHEERERLFDSIIPLFVGMTLLSPLVWEHHAIFLTLPFLLLLKKVDSPTEWLLYGAVYLLVFLTPTFDYFPWSYGRLFGMLILLGLLWFTRARNTNRFFPEFNSWAEALFHARAQTNAV
ncbi:MAG TPA: glycosyltransferase 87 family protein [Anaerolineales bacterium]|nr:glycosyltransferase 87 family protein [Anaerolineales bacterium]